MKKIFVLLRSDLLLTSFKCHPASVICYAWILKRLTLPALADHLTEVLPTALILADDYETENIKMGLECLHHIIENVAIAQLKYNGSDEVILDVLKKCMFQTEAVVVEPQLQCYIALMGNDLTHSTTALARNNFDQPIKTVLSNMYMEQKLALRLVYASNLANLIEARGLGIVRHLTLIFKILHEYTLEPSTTNKSLEALSKVVQVCWCRGKSVKESVTLILLKLCVELSRSKGKYEVDEVLRLARSTASLLIQAYPELTDELDEHICANDSIDQALGTVISQIFHPRN
ncbi:Hypothetical protein NTJ_05854 [Nesidiocoris tenuis]|nr:Hypothetical protein NTJ_05854 [Nesidiocoris tenuis]